MSRHIKRTSWRKVTLESAIEESTMQVLVRGKFQTRPIVRVMFRTPSGRVFSGPRIGRELRKELGQLA